MKKDFKTVIDGTGTTYATGRTHYICDMLRGEALIELYYLEGQVAGTTNGHLNFIKGGLLRYVFPNQCTYQVKAHDAP